MSAWTENRMDERLQEALGAVHLNNSDGHQFGRPYLSSYQLAIALVEDDPALLGALGKEVGGSGTGTNHSLAQYIGRELSRRIESGAATWVEGAFMSNERVQEVTYRGPDGPIVSSLAGSRYDMALFRFVEVGVH